MFDYVKYAQSLREEIHRYPEIGYDLTKTLGVVHRELDAMGIEYTDKYCRSSVVGYINPGCAFTVGLRADMDALPIQEEVDVPFKSRIPGQMHACGHDVHTAVLLAVARQLKDREGELKCTVKLIFSPAEEYADPGCRHLAENGVMDDVDCAITMHIASDVPVGQIQVNDGGPLNGNSLGFQADFYGKSCHAALQHNGKDAIMMAVEAVAAMQIMVAKEIDGRKNRVLNIGYFHGGEAANVLCDHVQLQGTLRTWEDEVNDYIVERLEQICTGTAAMAGGKAEFKVLKYLPHMLTHPTVHEKLREVAVRLVGQEQVVKKVRSSGGEDFAFLTRKKPCGQFKVGVKPADMTEKNKGHSGTLRVDNGCFKLAIDMFMGFVLDNMNGIDFG